MPLSKDLREFVECLNSNGVEYLIVGALAVSWHGYPRYSADVDLFVNAGAERDSCPGRHRAIRIWEPGPDGGRLHRASARDPIGTRAQSHRFDDVDFGCRFR